MITCASCGRENAGDARFCSGCGAALQATAPAREERKVVTCLFCDLVGFTARAERMDPEDVRGLLQPYHARVRGELERFGGTVEKFIGDAVMAVFGAPVAHEDDPERAIRAALAIQKTLAGEGELEIRIGITTGEALIALDARPESGEGMASGDVVNTAARIQAAAPVGAILVDETTRRATEGMISYAGTQSIEAKGKAKPVAVWQVVRAEVPVGAERPPGARLVGRRNELETLTETLSRALHRQEPELVVLVGVPGIGKTRLVRELFETVQNGSFGPVTWHRGRSLPYGEGVSFWAWGEIVKAEAEILETDAIHDAEAKLGRAIAEVVEDPRDADWVRRHLAPVLGIGGSGNGDDRRAERFAAWRRFLGAIADRHPLVLVFEDLHWADDALLDFVLSLPEWMADVPLLVLATARPELLERRPIPSGQNSRASVVMLEALNAGQTASLVDELLADVRIPPESRTVVLEQAGGNPLYAEQYVRMLAEGGEAHGVPETLHALIAARLDLLPAADKRLVQDASVIGGMFWTGAVAAVTGSDAWTVDEHFRALERRELVRRSRNSSVTGETEYVFTHALIRDAAYAGIPRSLRADRHLRTADWIESLGRVDEHAELLAHHYVSALDLAAAAGRADAGLEERALDALRRAGDRALSLYTFAAAAGFYRSAEDLARPGDPERPRVLLGLGRALYISEARGEEELLAARAALAEARDLEGTAEAEVLLADLYRGRGERESYTSMLEGAETLARQLPPSRAKAQVLVTLARALSGNGRFEEAIELARDALALAETLELDELRARSVLTLGFCRAELDEDDGLADLERSIDLAVGLGSPVAIAAYNNLAHQLRHRGEFARSLELFEEGLRVAERFGDAPTGRFMRGMLPQMRYRQGRWDEALELSDAFLGEVRAEHYNLWHALGTRALIRLSRGEEAGLADATASIASARKSVDASSLPATLEVYAHALVLAGRREEAAKPLEEALTLLETGISRAGFDLPFLAFVTLEIGGDRDRVLAVARPRTKWLDAARRYFDGDFGGAADVYGEIGSRPQEAEARMRAARSLLLLAGRRTEAEDQLQQALAFYRSVGATRFVREGEALLSATDSRGAPARARSPRRAP